MEEDIKIIEEFIEGEKAFGEYEGNKYFEAIQNLIARYKETKQELETNYIPKSKIKNKIQELKEGTYDAKIILQQLLED